MNDNKKTTHHELLADDTYQRANAKIDEILGRVCDQNDPKLLGDELFYYCRIASMLMAAKSAAIVGSEAFRIKHFAEGLNLFTAAARGDFFVTMAQMNPPKPH